MDTLDRYAVNIADLGAIDPRHPVIWCLLPLVASGNMWHETFDAEPDDPDGYAARIFGGDSARVTMIRSFASEGVGVWKPVSLRFYERENGQWTPLGRVRTRRRAHEFTRREAMQPEDVFV